MTDWPDLILHLGTTNCFLNSSTNLPMQAVMILRAEILLSFVQCHMTSMEEREYWRQAWRAPCWWLQSTCECFFLLYLSCLGPTNTEDNHSDCRFGLKIKHKATHQGHQGAMQSHQVKSTQNGIVVTNASMILHVDSSIYWFYLLEMDPDNSVDPCIILED